MFLRKKIYESLSLSSKLSLNINILCCAQITSTFGSEYAIAPHIHSSCEIMVPLKNDYMAILNGDLIKVSPGKVIVIQNGDNHCDCCQGDFSFFAARFLFVDNADQVRDLPIFKPELASKKRIMALSKSAISNKILPLILANFPAQHFIRSHTRKVLIEEFCWEIISMIPEKDMDPVFMDVFNGNCLLSKLEEFFSKNIKKNLTADQIAAHFYLSTRTLEKRLLTQGVRSPVSLFRQFKIREAIRLLTVEKKNVSETAEYLGFSSSFAFSRCCKKETGHAPSEFR